MSTVVDSLLKFITDWTNWQTLIAIFQALLLVHVVLNLPSYLVSDFKRFFFQPFQRKEKPKRKRVKRKRKKRHLRSR
ncbi:hypothetical protein [Ligilactobacillus agilis]|uniref:hypothetical protein n=1 Tax=Ligilactobacillus agilis TaxID=1601 RepID=UPI0014380CBD|nr:hypothetical protein [Ligilactobacillus agilis]MBL1055290.1 hypothetical protein [Ligilactobacillus agilis]MDY4064485.1 hypothetical protein [Ligilactobacillus agilis]GET18304.1 hypothetical protein PTL465_06220 [Ligilactobacillus agilis]